MFLFCNYDNVPVEAYHLGDMLLQCINEYFIGWYQRMYMYAVCWVPDYDAFYSEDNHKKYIL